MPVQFQSVLGEHLAVRNQVGFFDVTHLGRFAVRGTDASDALRRLFCNDVDRLVPGRTHYTMALNDDGGVIDDIVIWRWNDEDFWVLPNAANYGRIVSMLEDSGVSVHRLQEETVMLAVQGPGAPTVLEKVVGTAPRRFRTLEAEFAGDPVWLAGTGYTGEGGGEVCVPLATSEALAGALVEAGALPCGLGARDTLRLEAGLPLWGQELDEATTPLEAGFDWVVAWDHDFRGKAALEQQRQTEASKSLLAFTMAGRTIPRHGYRLRAGEAEGVVTSGNWSPVLECGIGLGYLAPPVNPTTVEVEIRGSWQPAEVVELPFIK